MGSAEKAGWPDPSSQVEKMRMQLGLLFFYLVAAFCSLEAAIPQQQPMGQDEVRDLIKKNKNNPEVILIGRRKHPETIRGQSPQR